MNYKIHVNNEIECGIELTTDEVDNNYVFNNFSDAKKEYIKVFKTIRDA